MDAVIAQVATHEFQGDMASIRERARCIISQTKIQFGCHNDVSLSEGFPAIFEEKQITIVPLDEAVMPNDEPLVAVLGVGYVGSHLVTSFAKQFGVIGFDVSHKRIQQLSQDEYQDRNIVYTSDPSHLTQATHFLISVPTLLKADKSIDSSYLEDAINTVGKFARTGSTVVIESSVAVGMTRRLLGPLAKEKGFFAGMSPERVDPGRTEPPLQSIPKVISGLDDVVPGSQAAILRIYKDIFENVIPVSKPEVAEMMKLYENCQRMVCIAYANEMADACAPLGIDPYEVCSAASTKPFGYMPYSPGVGVGGHCIPVNPFYLLSNSDFPLLEAATEAMWSRPSRLAERALKRLHRAPSMGAAASILVVGMGFKTGQSCLSNSPGVELARSLARSGKVDVTWADPLVSQDAIPEISRLADVDWHRSELQRFEMIIVVFKQVGIDFDVLTHLRDVQVEMWC